MCNIIFPYIIKSIIINFKKDDIVINIFIEVEKNDKEDYLFLCINK